MPNYDAWKLSTPEDDDLDREGREREAGDEEPEDRPEWRDDDSWKLATPEDDDLDREGREREAGDEEPEDRPEWRDE